MQRRNQTLITSANNNLAPRKIKNSIPSTQTTLDHNIEMEDQLGELWKVFGRETKAGQNLYKIYGAKHKKKINYPKPKTKKWDPEEARRKPRKPCPQKTKIEYPEVMTKTKLRQKRMREKITKLDLVPKRKNRAEILLELQKLYQARLDFVPAVKGRDRGRMIENLQEDFRYANDKANQQFEVTNEEEAKIQRALEAKIRQMSKKSYFNAPKQEKKPNPGDIPAKEFAEQNLKQLGELFDDIVNEIEERQKYLDSIENLDMKKAKEKIKGEIVDRVAELQKVNKLMEKEKALR